mgnify:CR=1 FL=1
MEFKRKPGESFESFIRRFNKRLQLDGRLMLAREKHYFHKKPNKRQVRQSALVRQAKKEKREYLGKIGQLKDGFRQ